MTLMGVLGDRRIYPAMATPEEQEIGSQEQGSHLPLIGRTGETSLVGQFLAFENNILDNNMQARQD